MTQQETNKALALEAFDAAFNKKDPQAFERYWSPGYIQHSALVEPGREGLQKIIANRPPESRYENSLIMAEGDLVMLYGRFTGIGRPQNRIVCDIVRIENGYLAEHWDVIQDEVAKEQSKSGLPMFGSNLSEAGK